MKGIIKRGNTYKWDVMVHGQRRYGYAPTEEQAYIQREHVRQQLLAMDAINSDLATIGGMSTLLLATEWAEENKKAHDWIKRQVRLVQEYFPPNTLLITIDNDAIDKYIMWLRNVQKNSNGTINRKIYILSRILRRARERKIISEMPVIRRQREPEGRLRFVTEEEEAKILQYFRSKNMYGMAWVIEVLIDTGIRCGELYKLTIKDIDWTKGKHGIITLRDTKNGETRSVPLTQRAHEALLSLYQESRDGKHFTPIDPHWMTKPWNAMKKALGWEHDEELVPHSLRHTCASRLVQRGAPLYTVSKWLGHKSLQTTKRYAHLRPEELYELTNLLEPDD